MKKTSIVIACYLSKTRDRVPTKYINDPLYFLKTHLELLKKMQNQFHKIYIVCTYDNFCFIDDDINEYIEQLKYNFDNIEIINRDNVGGSYVSWHIALNSDNNESDYMVFVEDDYILANTESVNNMLEYYKEEPNMIYLCQLWNRNRYVKDGVDIAEHAQVSNGMINVKQYHKLKANGLDFTLYYDDGKIPIYNNQASFLEQYRANGIIIRDMKDKYACVYLNDNTSVINFGNRNGQDIFMPISEWYPEHCPNLRYNW